MKKSKGSANFFVFILLVAVAVVVASIVDSIVKTKLLERVDVVMVELQTKKVESSATAKVMLCLNEFETSVKKTKFFEIDRIKSQVRTVNHIENFAKDSYLSKDELAKIQLQKICDVDMVDQSSRVVASKIAPVAVAPRVALKVTPPPPAHASAPVKKVANKVVNKVAVKENKKTQRRQ